MESLVESNAMFGQGGCCLGISYPQTYDMPVLAICEAACQMNKAGFPIKAPEDMIPLVGQVDDLKMLKNNAIAFVIAGMKRGQCMMPSMIRTMIEVPRAAILANQTATQAEFFSPRTNVFTPNGLWFLR